VEDIPSGGTDLCGLFSFGFGSPSVGIWCGSSSGAASIARSSDSVLVATLAKAFGGDLLNAYKTFQRPLRFCHFSFIFFLYPYKKAGKSSLIIHMKSPEIRRNFSFFPFLAEKGSDFLPDYPFKSPRNPQKLSFFSFYFFLFSPKKAKLRGRTDTQGYIGIHRER